jgi:hypothetical protein
MALVLSTWKLSHCDGSGAKPHFWRNLPRSEHLAVLNHILPPVIERCRILVTSLDEQVEDGYEADDVILGWLSYSRIMLYEEREDRRYSWRDTLVYGYVKPAFRHRGIFRAMMEKAGVDHFRVGITRVLAHGRRPEE